MKLTLEINGIIRTFQGSYEEMRNRDWNVRVGNMLDDAQEYEEMDAAQEMPGFEGTLEALNKIKI